MAGKKGGKIIDALSRLEKSEKPNLFGEPLTPQEASALLQHIGKLDDAMRRYEQTIAKDQWLDSTVRDDETERAISKLMGIMANSTREGTKGSE